MHVAISPYPPRWRCWWQCQKVSSSFLPIFLSRPDDDWREKIGGGFLAFSHYNSWIFTLPVAKGEKKEEHMFLRPQKEDLICNIFLLVWVAGWHGRAATKNDAHDLRIRRERKRANMTPHFFYQRFFPHFNYPSALKTFSWAKKTFPYSFLPGDQGNGNKFPWRSDGRHPL